MKLCIVGIGGAGGNIAKKFLRNEDLNSKLLSRIIGAQYVSPGDIKGIWLEADINDSINNQYFFGNMQNGCYPSYYIPHEAVQEGSAIHVSVREKYGYDVKKQGFVRDAQYLKAIFEIFDTDKEIQKIVSPNESMPEDAANNNGGSLLAPNPIFDSAWSAIRRFTTLGEGECDGILFVVSFGGGTGTGTINPIINHIRKEGKLTYPVFVLGILTEPGDSADQAQFSKSKKRNLAAISAIYDLLSKGGGASGVIIIDNKILLDKYGTNYDAANNFIHKIMQPMVAARDYPQAKLPSQAFAQNSSTGLDRPPIFVPLFASLPRSATEEELIDKALSKEGRLFGCTPEKSDTAWVFCRGFIKGTKIKRILSDRTGIPYNMIYPVRKMGEGQNEILILLRNPYGGDSEAYKKDGTLEKRLCFVISEALRQIREHPDELYYEGKTENGKIDNKQEDLPNLTELSKMALKKFFFGADGTGKTSGLTFELEEARRRLREGGEQDKPFFMNPLSIFEKESEIEREYERYEFCWNKIPGEHNKQLIEFLDERLCIDWAKNAEIKKIDDNTITVSAEKNSLSLILNDEKTKVILEIGGIRKDSFVVKIKNGELIIYNRDEDHKLDENYIVEVVNRRIKELIKEGKIKENETDRSKASST